MTTTTQTRKSTKHVQIIARYELKRNGHIVYTVRSSNGNDTYTATLVNGKATGCSCPATKPCYHMTGLETIEANRKAQPVRKYNITDPTDAWFGLTDSEIDTAKVNWAMQIAQY